LSYAYHFVASFQLCPEMKAVYLRYFDRGQGDQMSL
jgi:hypothetical protein